MGTCVKAVLPPKNAQNTKEKLTTDGSDEHGPAFALLRRGKGGAKGDDALDAEFEVKLVKSRTYVEIEGVVSQKNLRFGGTTMSTG